LPSAVGSFLRPIAYSILSFVRVARVTSLTPQIITTAPHLISVAVISPARKKVFSSFFVGTIT